MSAVERTVAAADLQLGWYEFVSIRVESNPEFEDEGYDGELTVSLAVEPTPEPADTGDNQLWLVSLSIEVTSRPESDSPPHPYEVALSVRGLFTIGGYLSETDASELLAPAAAATLYASARELLLGLTGRCSHGSFQLPDFDFTTLRTNPEESPG